MKVSDIRHFFILASSVIFLAGCATPYQPIGFRGGYTQTQLDENVFQVRFRGNGFTGRERASDFTLLRCAEATLENGYAYFAIVEKEAGIKKSTYTTPSTTTIAPDYAGGYSAYTTGGQTYTLSKPRTVNTIVMFKEKPSGGFSYNAQFIIKGIKEKYRITNL